jgi:CheY-like chemotaxis protein
VPAPAPAQASPQERQLRNDVDAYFHYAWIGRYDLASQFAQKVTDEASDPAALIPILGDIAKLHDQNMGYMAQLLLFDKQPQLKDSTDKLLLKVQAGNIARAQDPMVIEQTIRDMSLGERGYENHLPILRRSGELAIPVMIQFLRLEDDQHKPFRGTVRRALVDMGRSAVNPLLAAADMKDSDTLLPIIDALGNLGYDAAAPVLARLARDPNSAAEVKVAAASALGRLGISTEQANDPATMYYGLALRFYYNKADIGQTINNPGPSPDAPVQTCDYWTWEGDKGLVPTPVPASIFNDLMTLRACDSALSLNADLSDAVSLWLDADNKREADLPAGATDPIRGNTPPAHYFNVSAGARHLDDALARSLADHNAAVSLKLTHSLGLIVGRSTMSGQAGYPLTDALRFPDKAVRYEAACALASALPDKQFNDQDLVVPLLVQAIGEGGGGNVLVVASNQDDANGLQESLRKIGYVTTTATSAGEAVSAASNLPSVDAIVIARGVPDEEVGRVIEIAGQTSRLQGAVDVVMAATDTGYPAAAALKNPLVSVSTESAGDALKKDIEAARAKAGLAPLDVKAAGSYAMRAALALENLAVGRNQVLNLSVAESGLLNALNGQRAELVAAIGNVLARFSTQAAQQGLARRALDDAAPQPIRISLFQALTVSAKTFGNQLDSSQVAQLQKEAVELKDNDIRSAAAEARGALNLPTDEATNLILSQGAPGNQQ